MTMIDNPQAGPRHTGDERVAPLPYSSRARPDWLILTAIAVIVGTFGAWFWLRWDGGGRPRRFWTVVPGVLYRGAYTTDHATVSVEALRNIVRNNGIRTLVSLTEDPRSILRVEREQSVIAECGLAYVNISMPGNGAADFDSLDRAADALADPRHQPVYFRCAAGKQRSNAAQAAWRMKHCGWTIDQALQELDGFDLDRSHDARMIENLRKYYMERILPARKSG